MNCRIAVAGIVLAVASVVPVAGGAYAQNDLDCRDFTFQEDAQAEFNRDRSDPHRLDEDQGPDDGIACEALPRRNSGTFPQPITPTRPTTLPTRGVAGGFGGGTGPSTFDTYLGLTLTLGGAALTIGYAATARRRRS